MTKQNALNLDTRKENQGRSSSEIEHEYYGQSAHHTAEGELMFDLLYRQIELAPRIKAVAQKLDLVNAWGGGHFDLLRSLLLNGPQTVPHLAKSRSIMRQSMQKLANDLEKDGLVNFVDNPKHKRSKLVQLTYKGRQVTQAQTEDLKSLGDILAAGLPLQDLKIASEMTCSLNERLERLLDDME